MDDVCFIVFSLWLMGLESSLYRFELLRIDTYKDTKIN